MRNYIQDFLDTLTDWFNDETKSVRQEIMSRIENGYAENIAREFYGACVKDLVEYADVDDDEIVDYVVDYLRLHGTKDDCLEAIVSHKKRIYFYLKSVENDIIEDLIDYLTFDYGD